ncbi:MAG: ATP-binding protein [Pseudomonadales bacterium]
MSSDDEQALSLYRSLAVTAAMVIPGFGIVRRIIDPGTIDPLWERIGISVFLLAFAALTMVDGPVRRHPQAFIAASLYMVSAGVIHMAYVNGLSVNTSYGLLILLFACSLALRSRAMLAAYLISTALGIGATVLLAEVVEIDPLFFMTAVVAVGMLTYSVQVNRIVAEGDLRQARDLAEAAVAARGRFLANMSHEIRTPMNGVIGMAGLLEGTELTSSQRDYLRTIRTSGEGLLLLINDILDFSKIESGHVELERAPFDPLDCLEEALALVTQTAREKGLELICESAPDLPAQVLGDSLRLRQVLVNLLSNAVKFTERGDVKVLLKGKSEGRSGFRLSCRISDTGVGISEADIGGLFRAFAQADSSTTRRFGGTGLGLSICRQLVERMGGRIRVASRELQGSTFEFDVLMERSPPADGGAEIDLGAAALLQVLVIEPHAGVRAAISRQLVGWGIDHRMEANAAAALQRFEHDRFTTVLAGCSAAEAAALEAVLETGGPRVIRLAPMSESPTSRTAVREPRTVLFRPLRRRQLWRALLAAAPGADGSPAGDAGAVLPAVVGSLPGPADGSADADPSVAALRILVAEDNAVNQRVTLKMLQRLGCEADLAPNGELAVQAVAGGDYDVVLMDLQMPVMDGLEATRQIRRLGAAADAVRIVAMTANAMRGDRETCLAAGMDDYLCKPVTVEQLRALLNRFSVQAEAAKSTSRVMSSSISKNECASVART